MNYKVHNYPINLVGLAIRWYKRTVFNRKCKILKVKIIRDTYRDYLKLDYLYMIRPKMTNIYVLHKEMPTQSLF